MSMAALCHRRLATVILEHIDVESRAIVAQAVCDYTLMLNTQYISRRSTGIPHMAAPSTNLAQAKLRKAEADAAVVAAELKAARANALVAEAELEVAEAMKACTDGSERFHIQTPPGLPSTFPSAHHRVQQQLRNRTSLWVGS
jgi:hypothetical protein